MSGQKRGISDVSDVEQLTFTKEWKRVKKEEAEEMYTPLPEITQQLDDCFAGQFKFSYIFADDGTGQDWTYSQTLDKLFIKMEKVLPLKFVWDPPIEGLHLRTAMAFKLEQYKNDPVRRCYNHMASTDITNQNMDAQKIKHVVHCVNHSSSIYVEKNEKLSILTPLRMPEPGSSYMPMCYKFLCKNSCPSGINRRPTELVFTLEDLNAGTILGRRKLLVRICSCPKRDRQKEEGESTPNNSGNNLTAKKKPIKHSAHSGKKMPPLHDQHVYKVNLNIVGKENYLAILKYAYDITAGQAMKTGQFEFLKPYMDDILHNMP
ncbi:PREDICTED: cellular tumor antigen p53 isoform X2 [Dinoponera quadriceps]|nr:PREDICTED: cellular tumor antigen p53 isoform X2 [Dinoponera quadriceps]